MDGGGSFETGDRGAERPHDAWYDFSDKVSWADDLEGPSALNDPELDDDFDTGDDLDVEDLDEGFHVELPDDFFTAPEIVEDFPIFDPPDSSWSEDFHQSTRIGNGGGGRRSSHWWDESKVVEPPVVVRREYPLDAPTGIVDDPHESREIIYPITPKEVNKWVDENSLYSREQIRDAFEAGRFTPDPQINIDRWVANQTDATELAMSLAFLHGYEIDEESQQGLRLAQSKSPLALQALYYASSGGRVAKPEEVAVLIKQGTAFADAIIHKAVKMGFVLAKEDVNELCTHGNRQSNGAIFEAMKSGQIKLSQSQLDVIVASTPNKAAGVDPLITEISHLAISGFNQDISF